MDTDKKLREHISALADGELPDSERELVFAALDTKAGQAAWRAYHVTGGVLRSTSGDDLSDDFSTRLAARLAAEPPYAAADAALEVQPAAIIFP